MKTFVITILVAGTVGSGAAAQCDRHFEGVGTLDSTVAAMGYFDDEDGGGAGGWRPALPVRVDERESAPGASREGVIVLMSNLGRLRA
jgi:hypothetical protein